MCDWFALCDRDADGTISHPVLGDVQTCKRCAHVVDADADLELYEGEGD